MESRSLWNLKKRMLPVRSLILFVSLILISGLAMAGESVGPIEAGETFTAPERGYFVPEEMYTRVVQVAIDLGATKTQLEACQKTITSYTNKDQRVKDLEAKIQDKDDIIDDYKKLAKDCTEMSVGGGIMSRLGIYAETGFNYDVANHGSQYYGGGVIFFLGK